MARLGIIAGTGALPGQIAAAHPGALFLALDGVGADLPGGGIETARASYERFGALFGTLRTAGVTEVVLAGALVRPALDPARFDAVTMTLAPRLAAAMQGGDDALLRAVIAAFEAEGFAVRGAHELLPGLTAAAGLLAGPEPGARDLADLDRASEILAALGPLDVGQGAVVSRGLCLGVETVQGTDAMLQFAADAPAHLRRGGVLLKAPKPGQDLRVDMPAIGPRTVALAAAAGLSGIAIAAGGVVIAEREATCAAAAEAGLFVLAKDL